MKKAVFLVFCAIASALYAYEWKNAGGAAHIGGRMVSPGYLRGKIVLVDCRDYSDPASEEEIKKLLSAWAAYKTKPFIILGSHRGGGREAAKAAIDRLGVTYPVCENAGISEGEPEYAPGRPLLYLMDSTCTKILYRVRDAKMATSVLGSALMSISTPSNAKQYKRLIDWEKDNLPGRCLLRLKEFRERFPAEAGEYDALWKTMSADGELVRLAKLVELARLVKDRDTGSEKAKKLTPKALAKTAEKYESLKSSSRPAVVQEAKNALADLKWAAAAMSAR